VNKDTYGKTVTARHIRDILVVDDSKAQLKALEAILKQKGYQVKTAHDGVDGLYMLMSSCPDLIISDVQMPKMNGYEFCRVVKDDKKLQHIPFILITSLSNTEDIVNGLNAGADYYLTKPFSEDLLLFMVKSIQSGPSVNREDATNDLELQADDKTLRISANPQQILNFLFSTYENLLYHNQKLAQTKQDLKLLNDHLEEGVREKTKSLEKTLQGIVVALSKTVEMRDPYTSGHQLRVAQLACSIAQEIGMPEGQIGGIRVMGLLHDLGKIIIPAEILSKPSKLTDYEFQYIKVHPQAGHDILKEIDFPWPITTAIVQHHERLDGSGYPRGLSEHQIILEAQILAVADVVEAMATHRPYRPALGIDVALKEISKNNGTLYAPSIVDAVFKLYHDKKLILDKMP
jgi:putative nucleotidyltransferase with HDIG domain